MNRALIIISIVMTLISLTQALAVPAPAPPQVYIKNVTIQSSIVKFVVCYLNPDNNCSYKDSGEINTFLSEMSIDRKYEKLTFEVVLVNDSQEISMYKGNLYNLRLPDSLGNGTNNSLYKFPINIYPYPPTLNSFERLDPILSHFDNQTLIVKLNGTIVREYTLGYFPGGTSGYSIPRINLGIYSIDTNFFILICFLSVFLLVVIIFLVKRRHDKRK